MAFRPWSRLFLFASLLGAFACGGGNGGSLGGDGGAGGEGGAGSEGPTLSIGDAEIKEGNSAGRDLTFTVQLSRPSSETVRVSYETKDAGAHSGGDILLAENDYDAESATLRFEPGETEQTFSVTVLGDRINEGDEVFSVVLSKPQGAEIEDGEAAGTIRDDDDLPSVSITSAGFTEGNSGSKNASLILTLSEPSGVPVTVEYSTLDGTASDGEDYVGADGRVTFAPGEVGQSISVEIEGDTEAEGDETLSVVLSNPENATLDRDQATITILNDDLSGPALSIDDAIVSEGSAGLTDLSFVIRLAPVSNEIVTVDYATVDGTATAGGVAATGGFDYIASSDSVSFAPGETEKLITVSVYGDTLDEGDETLAIELFNGVGATVIDPQAAGTIENDDSAPVLSIADVDVDEGAAGTRMATFLLTLSKASGRDVSVDFDSQNGSASAGTDYVATSGTLTIAAGQTFGYVSVTVNGDVLNEADETFSVLLSNAAGVTVNDTLALGTINNDDAAPSLGIGDVQLTEGDAGTKNATFTVSLSAASGQPITVDWATANDSALSPSDYGASGGTLSFAAGITVRTISVAVYGDTTDEPAEEFVVNLSNAVNASIGDAQGVCTIAADDSTLPGLSIDDVSVAEGNAGDTTLTFTVSLEFQVAQQVTVSYSTIADTASAGSDFDAVVGGSVTFLANELSKTVSITVSGDTLYELDEGLWVALFGESSNAFVADGYGYGIISNDDSVPTLSISDASLSEGNSGTKNATFTISLSAASSLPVNVAYATADDTAVEGGVSALGQNDYEASSDVVSIAAGATSVQVSVAINGDTVPEPNELFWVVLSGAQNATINDSQAQCTITNDDAIPSISIDDVSAVEGDAGSKSFTFTLTLSSPSGNQVTVDFDTANGTAISPSDYQAKSGTVTFAPGETTATIAITVIGEKAAEAHNDETFYVNLTNPSGATIGDAQGLGTIQSDD